MNTITKHAQSWSQQRRVCRPAQPLRVGDSFKYHDSSSHASSAAFRRRQQQRAREIANAQPA